MIKNLEAIRPSAIIDIIHSAEALLEGERAKRLEKMSCERCGYLSSNKVCQACKLLDNLNEGEETNEKIQIAIESDQ